MSYLLLVLATLFWSGNFIISRGMHNEIPPFTLSFWRWFLALFLLSFFGMPRLWRQRLLIKQNLKYIIVQGLLGVAGFNSLIYLALQTTTAINAVVVNSCIPVLIVVCSWGMYREVLSIRQCSGVLVSLGGVMLIILRGDLGAFLNLDFNRGDILVFIAATIWALYTANLKRYPEGLDPIAYLTGIIIAGLIGILPFYGMEIFQGKIFHLNHGTVLTISYVAIFASVLAFIFWNKAVRTIGVNKAGPFVHLMPVFSTLLAIIFLGEKLYSFHIIGIFLIFIGISLASYSKPLFFLFKK